MPKKRPRCRRRQAKRLRRATESRLGCRSGLGAFIGRELEHRFAHFLAGFEFDNGARRNADVVFRSIRVAANTGLAYFHFEDPKVSQFDLLPLRNSSTDVIKRFLWLVVERRSGRRLFFSCAGRHEVTRVADRNQPPAIAGMMLTSSPSFIGVC